MMEIYKSFIFDAAHRLPNVPQDHKCARMHGHTYTVTIYVEAELDQTTGWVMDFATIKKAFGPIYKRLDHHYLNDIEGLENSTSENLALWIWKELKPTLPELSKIIVSETPDSGVVYCGQ